PDECAAPVHAIVDIPSIARFRPEASRLPRPARAQRLCHGTAAGMPQGMEAERHVVAWRRGSRLVAFSMKHYRYLIIGGGMTADAAARAIRAADPAGAVGLISAEPHPPYNRPPLSKGLWKGDPESGIWRGTDTLGVDVRLGRRVTAIDATKRAVSDDRGDVVSYDKLLLATGGTPRRLPFGGNKQIIYYRTYDDYRRLHALAQEQLRFAVLGGGFIGSEVAAALRIAGRDVVMLNPP